MIVAFDLGTSFCRAAIVQNDTPRLICSFPSVVCFIKEKILVGDEALNMSHDYPTTVVYDSKRIFEKKKFTRV